MGNLLSSLVSVICPCFCHGYQTLLWRARQCYFRWGLRFCSLCHVEHPAQANGSQPLLPRPQETFTNVQGHFCHFKDDCCLCLVGRGQRSFSVSCGALHSPQNKWCQTPKRQCVSGQERTGYHCVSIKHSQKQTTGHIKPVRCAFPPVLSSVYLYY